MATYLSEATARAVFDSINTGQVTGSPAYEAAVVWACTTPGMTPEQIYSVATANGQSLKPGATQITSSMIDQAGNIIAGLVQTASPYSQYIIPLGAAFALWLLRR